MKNKTVKTFEGFSNIFKSRKQKQIEELYGTKDLSLQKKEIEQYTDIEPLTIKEFSLLREAMYAVRTSDSPSAFQAKEFFKDEENFETVVEKLRKLLEYGNERH